MEKGLELSNDLSAKGIFNAVCLTQKVLQQQQQRVTRKRINGRAFLVLCATCGLCHEKFKIEMEHFPYWMRLVRYPSTHTLHPEGLS
jgi:hypothetical protein